jgi:hypothetical protein
MNRPAATIASLAGLLVACVPPVPPAEDSEPAAAVVPAPARGPADARAEFESHLEPWLAWFDQPHRASNSGYYTSHPEFRAMVAMGDRAVPFIIERLRARKNPFLLLALEEITGLSPGAAKVAGMDKRWGPGRPLFGGQDPFHDAWIEWWEANEDDPRWRGGGPGR